MATHDYVIDNQNAPSFRSDLNNALAAIVSTNSSSAAPSTTFANMLWYDTTNNQIKKRNEANSAWITLGDVSETNSTFTPNSALTTSGISASTLVTSSDTIAANDNNTTIPTSAAVKDYADSVSISSGQTWQDVSGSRSFGTSYQNTTGRPIMVNIGAAGSAIGGGVVCFQVSSNNSTWINIVWRSDGSVQQISAIVPDTWYYRTQNVTTLSSGGGWSEFR